MLGFTFRLILGFLLFFAVACTKAKPSLQVLDSRNVPQPRFSGQTILNITVRSSATTLDVTGECDVKIRSLQAEVSGVSDFNDVSSVAAASPAITCGQDGKFAFTLKSLADLGFASPMEGQIYSIFLRALSSGGTSLASEIRILYSTPNGNGPRRMSLTSGGTESNSGAPRLATSTHFQAEIRVDHRLVDMGTSPNANSNQLQTGSHFKLKIGSGAAAD